MIVLYDFRLSGNSHKVRLLLSMLKLDFESRHVDLFAHEQDHPDFARLNPKREVPVLVDGETVVYDSQAILMYLAATYAPQWLAQTPVEWARMGLWFSTVSTEVSRGLQLARLHFWGAKEAEGVDIAHVHEVCAKCLAYMDSYLEGREWLCAERPTVADLACFPYVALAHEGRVDVTTYPNVTRWVDRVRDLPGFVGMEGIAGPASSRK